MAFKLTLRGAYKILSTYFDGTAEVASLSLYLYTAGSPTINTATTSGFTEAANYTRPVLSTSSGDAVMGTSEGTSVGNPSSVGTSQITITFTGTTSAIIGYLVLDTSSNVIAWDTLSSSVTSQGSGDTLKLSIVATLS